MSEISVFISYPPAEEALAARLRAELAKASVAFAPRRHEVPVGMRWKPALGAALKASTRFLACFSARDGGPVQFVEDELAMAIEHLRTLPADRPWLVPVKLTACDLPARLFGDGEVLEGIDPVDLSADWEGGIVRIVSVLAAPPSQGGGTGSVEMTNTVRGTRVGGKLDFTAARISGPGELGTTVTQNNVLENGVTDHGASFTAFERKS
jgi:hypothetical protein